MKKAIVLGSGGWGTALALALVENGHQVTLWSYTQEEYQVLADTRENPMLKGVPLDERLQLTTDIGVVAECDVVVIATPSFAVRSTARLIKELITPQTVVVSVSKGIEKESSCRLSEAIEAELGQGSAVVVLSGPSHAEEVGAKIPTGLVAAADTLEHAEYVQELFMSERLRVYTSTDRVGTEICAALKNVVALAAGCCDGMGFGDNTKAMMMTRGLAEMARLGVALGAQRESFAGLAGVGDLIVTCTSMHSRNRRCGILIGQGVEPKEAVAQIGGVVEGYYAAANARALALKAGVELPIAQMMYEVLYEGRPMAGVVTELMTREKRHEQD